SLFPLSTLRRVLAWSPAIVKEIELLVGMSRCSYFGCLPQYFMSAILVGLSTPTASTRFERTIRVIRVIHFEERFVSSPIPNSKGKYVLGVQLTNHDQEFRTFRIL